MAKCKYCQGELAADSNICPACGEINGKKATPGKIALAVAAVVVLAAALIALIISGKSGKTADVETTVPVETQAPVVATHPADGNPDDVTCKGTYTVSDEEAAAARDTVVATIGDAQLTNGQLQVYYWSYVNNFLSSEYGYYMMMYGLLDYSQPLDVQFSMSEENLTWQQYFLQEALKSWNLNHALAQEAANEGYVLTPEQEEYLANLPVSLGETAASYNMTLDELMLANIGPGAGVEEFIQLQHLSLAGQEYYQARLDAMIPTQEELEAYFAAHEAEYAESGINKDETYTNVRHILVKVKGGTVGADGITTYSDEDWEACRAEAQAILDQWLAGEVTEDAFAALANEKSEDPGSSAVGGLYEDIYVGQMVEPFENWCFDESRQYGDYGLVQTSYGYHVMFFVSSEPAWVGYAESDWTSEQTNAMMDELTGAYPMVVDYSKIVLGFIDMTA